MDPEVYLLDPGEWLHDYLRALYYLFMGEPTLYIKQTEENPQAVPVERPAETASPTEPARSPV